jgi:hypothetical protein
MALGTLEGPGPLGGSRELVLGWASVRRRRQLAIERLTGARASLRGDPRQVGCDLSSGIRGRLFMTASWLTLARLGLPDPTLRWLLGAWKGGLPMDRSWVSEVLPAQLLRLGPMVFAAVPGEPTTTAGRRLAAGLRASLAASGVTDVAVAPYANAYSGYITTRQEYLCQHYEGASTLYGPWTLAMWQSVFGELAAGPLCARGAVPGPATVVMSLDDLVRERELGRQALGRGAHWIAGQRLERVYT